MNGEKTSITFAGQADAVVTFARTGEPGSRAGGVSAFLLPTDSQGITTTRFRDLGNRVVGRGSYFFDDVFVPEEYLLGEEGKGFGQVMHGFDYSRALLGLLCLGTAQASLDDSWAYVNEREAFGKTLSEFQGVTFPLAEFETRVAAARELCYHALRLKDEGKPGAQQIDGQKGGSRACDVGCMEKVEKELGHIPWIRRAGEPLQAEGQPMAPGPAETRDCQEQVEHLADE